MPVPVPESRFLRAARRLPVDVAPVWFMRQAGRSIPDYRRIRERHSVVEIARTPELAVEVALQPVRLLGVDAAILFADIMLPVQAMGVQLDLVEGVGPVVDHPVRAMEDVARLRPLDPEEGVPFVLETVRQLKAELGPRTPVIGFAGAPFTLASYLVEGRPTRDFARVKALMFSEPGIWGSLMDRLAEAMIRYLAAQVEAGAAALQLFDSWAGALAPSDYAQFVLPYTRRVFEGLAGCGVPLIHFGTGTATLLELMRLAGGDVIGVDWRLPLSEAWRRIGHDRGVQGNLDPGLLLAPPQLLAERAHQVLREAGGRPGHIFNLGHGVLPDAPVASLQRLVEAVHAFPLQQGGSAMSAKPAAVLLMAYGTPESLDEVAGYYTDVRGGRAPSPEALAELQGRYAAIGGRTPLLDLTRELARKLQDELGGGYRVHVGMRHWHPYIAAAVQEIAAEGAVRLIGLPLAPHYSRLSVGGYRAALDAALAQLAQVKAPPEVTFVERWHDQPGFRRLIAQRVRDELAALPPATHVVFTAHSLPERIRTWDDPYPHELHESAAAIAELAGTDDWELGYQSAGRTPEPWLGPDLGRVVERLAGEGRRSLLVVPFGFTCDHLEVLYDVDIEARAAAERLGLTLRRTRMPNADPEYVALLAGVVRQAAAG